MGAGTGPKRTAAICRKVLTALVHPYPNPWEPSIPIHKVHILGLQSDLQQQRPIPAALLFFKFTFAVCGPEHYYLLYIYIVVVQRN